MDIHGVSCLTGTFSDSTCYVMLWSSDTHSACFRRFAESIAPRKNRKLGIWNASCSQYRQHAARSKSRFQNTSHYKHNAPHDRKLHMNNTFRCKCVKNSTWADAKIKTLMQLMQSQSVSLPFPETELQSYSLHVLWYEKARTNEWNKRDRKRDRMKNKMIGVQN